MSHYNLHELALRQAGDLPDSDSCSYSIQKNTRSEILKIKRNYLC